MAKEGAEKDKNKAEIVAADKAKTEAWNEGRVCVLYNVDCFFCDPRIREMLNPTPDEIAEKEIQKIFRSIAGLKDFVDTDVNILVSESASESKVFEGFKNFGIRVAGEDEEADEEVVNLLNAYPSQKITFFYMDWDAETEKVLKGKYSKATQKYFTECQIKKISFLPGQQKKKGELEYKFYSEEVHWKKEIVVSEDFISFNNMNFWMDRNRQVLFDHLVKIRQPVLVLGPRGTGKTTAVQTIVQQKIGNKHFKVVNCSVLNGTLADDRLFGHVKGAFTDAREETEGFVGEANGGCLYLDEVQDLERETQRKLLKCLEEHVYQKVGSSKEYSSSFFLVCSSNRPLKELQSLLWEDFYDRISTFQIEMESLEDLKKKNGFLESVLPKIWDNYDKKTENDYFYNYAKTSRDFPELIMEVQKALKNNVLLGNYRDIEKLIAYLDLNIFNFESGTEVRIHTKPAIEMWEEYIRQRNANSVGDGAYVSGDSSLSGGDNPASGDSSRSGGDSSISGDSPANGDNPLRPSGDTPDQVLDSIMESLKWDGMNKLFRRWLAQWATDKYGSYTAAAKALEKDKNVFSRALSDE